MAVTTIPAIKSLRLWRAWIILMFLGLLSLAAVQKMRVECRNQYVMLEDGNYLLLNNGGRLLRAEPQQFQLVIGNIRVPLPAWAQSIIMGWEAMSI